MRGNLFIREVSHVKIYLHLFSIGLFQNHDRVINDFRVINFTLSSADQTSPQSVIQTDFTVESLHFTAVLKWLTAWIGGALFHGGLQVPASSDYSDYQSPAKIRRDWAEESEIGQAGKKRKMGSEVFLNQRLRQNQEVDGSVQSSSIQNRSFGLKMWVVFLTDVWRNTHGCVHFQSVFFTFMYFFCAIMCLSLVHGDCPFNDVLK